MRTVETEILSDSIADGDQVFKLDSKAPRNNMVEYFHFIDSGGEPVNPTAGDVIITFNSGNGIYQTIENGGFLALNAQTSSRKKPNGYGRATEIKINLLGVLGGGAVGFKSLVTQSVG